MQQSWEDLLFAHWPVPARALRPLVPHGLDVETHDGTAWLGIVPFRLAGLRLRRGPRLPRVHSFVELNVRTYVTDGERPGVWFFSLDASSRAAVVGARRTYRLPYHLARMAATERDGWMAFSSERVAGCCRFAARYRPAGEVAAARAGTIEHFVAERYCLYASGRTGRLYRAEVEHEPWPLQQAQAEIATNTMAPPGLELPGAPLLHFSRRVDVRIWPLRRI
jgi:uncharacterized protein YqjF (DUF2071 family)